MCKRFRRLQGSRWAGLILGNERHCWIVKYRIAILGCRQGQFGAHQPILALKIVLSTAVYVTSCERSFSKLKLMESDLRILHSFSSLEWEDLDWVWREFCFKNLAIKSVGGSNYNSFFSFWCTAEPCCEKHRKFKIISVSNSRFLLFLRFPKKFLRNVLVQSLIVIAI